MARRKRLAGIADLLVGFGLALSMVGCSTTQPTIRRDDPYKGNTPGGYKVSRDPWVLTCTDPNDPTPALLWNGLIGIRIGRNGSGDDEHTDPLGFLAIDEYEVNGEEKIVPLPTPLAMRLSDSLARPVTPASGNNYRQTLDMRSGVLSTEWDQVVGEAAVTVKCETVLHPGKRIVGQKWTLASDRWVPLYAGGWPRGAKQLTEVDEGGDDHSIIRFRWPPQRRNVIFELSTSGGVSGLTNVFESDAGPGLAAVVEPGKPAIFTVMCSLGLSSTYLVQGNQRGNNVKPAKGWDEPQAVPSFASLVAASRRVWSDRWKTDIEIDGPVEDQQAIRSFLFYLRSAIHPDGGMSISPFGLSNPLYNGHVFWDADIWVFPALAFVDPREAQAISDYRQRLDDGSPSNVYENFGLARGLQFPWESGLSGREVAPRKFRRQLHVTGSVLWMLAQSAALGLLGKDQMGLEGWDSAHSFETQAAFLYFHLASTGHDGKRRMKDVMSVDENHVGDNDLYTNLLAQWVINGLAFDGEARFHLPRDDKTFLTYDNDPLRAYNQAAAVLAIYPLQYPPAEKEARQMMERFAGKVSENGPAMSDSIHATIWARIGESEKAYKTWRKSWQRYTNHPLLLFSERPKSGQTYFTTGAAGCLNAVIYGFLGFRIDEKKQPGAVWSKQLLGARWLSIKPNLPKAWKSVKFRNFKVLGKSYTLTVTHEGARVSQGER